MDLSLSIVFSFRNEEAALPLLIPRLRAFTRALGLKKAEFVFVNDCSTDGSLQYLLKEQAIGKDIVVVNTSRRFGVSECVIAGMQEATGDFVAYMDADLQDPPELIGDMLKIAVEQQADVVYTTRRSRAGETWIKLQVTKIGYWILNTFSTIEVPPNSGDFKLLSRRVVGEVLRLKEQKPFMRGLVSWVGFKQVQFFYDREPRAAGESHFPVFSKKVIYNFIDSAMISYSDAPLKAALFVGMMVTVISFFMLIGILIQRFIGLALPGWTGIMFAISFFGGIQLLVLGVLGLYIHTIYLQVKGRPLYIVDRVYRPDGRESENP